MDAPKPIAVSAEDLLTRSAFGLLLVGGFVTLLSELSLIFAPVVPRRWVIAYALLFLLALGAIGFVLRAPLAWVRAVMRTLTRLLGHPRIALLLGIALFVASAAAIVIANEFYANRPFAIFLVPITWVLLSIVVLGICNATVVRAALARTRGAWVVVGMGLTVGLFFIAIVAGVNYALRATGIRDRARAQQTYETMTFYGHVVNPDWNWEYWREIETMNLSWLPFSYWRSEPFHTQFINVDDAGLRATASLVSAQDSAPRVFFFGGSTVWGYGSRDDYTLPSSVARVMSQAGRPVQVVNFGQIAYVSAQDLALFQRQLVLGNLPDVAVFYQGFNDLSTLYSNEGIAGLTATESNRVRDLASGNVLRDGGFLLRPPNLNLHSIDLSLVGIPDATPVQVADILLENARQVRALGREYGVRTLFVWQPSIAFKKQLTPEEQAGLKDYLGRHPSYIEDYRAADQELRRRVETDGLDDFLIISDMFADDLGFDFMDEIHVNEDINEVIANAIAPPLTVLLDAPTASS